MAEIDEFLNKVKDGLTETFNQGKTIMGQYWGQAGEKNRQELTKQVGTLAAFGLAVKSTDDGLKKLATGTYSTADAVSGLGNTIKGAFDRVPLIGGILSSLGSTATDAVNAMMAVNDSLRTTSKNGVYFKNDLGDYSLTLAKARMSTEQFQTMLAESSQSIGSFGFSMDSGAKRYLEATKQFQENSQVETLIKTGVGMDELNKTMMLFGSRMTRSGKSQEDFTKFLADGAAKFATQMDDISRITGISKEQQQRSLDLEMQRAENLQYQLKATPEQIEGLKNVTNQTQQYGTEIQQLAEEMYRNNGQVVSKAGADTMAKIGAAGGSALKEYSKLMAAGKGTEAKSVLDNQFNKKLMDFATSRAAGGLMQTSPDWGKTFQPAMEYLFSEKQLAEEAAKNNISLEEMRKKRAEEMKADREKTAAEKPGEAQAASAALNSATRLAADASIAVTGSFNGLNTKLGQSLNELDAFNKALRFRSAGELETMLPGSKKEPEIKRDTGSLGKAGSLLEDWGSGTPVMLHGMEGIVTADQFKMIGEGLNKSLQGMFVGGDEMSDMLKGLGVEGFGSGISKNIKAEGIAAPEKKEEKGFFDTVTDMFYDVGNIAGKMFDDVTKTTINNKSPGSAVAEQRAALDSEAIAKQKEAEQLKIESERRQQEEQKASEARKATESTKKEQNIEEKSSNTTLNDLKDQLVELNKNVKDLISHTDKVAEQTGRNARATEKGNNRLS